MESSELIIVGAGAAGLAAGIYAARSGLKTLILEEKIAGGTMADAPSIDNYPGFRSIAGLELAQRIVDQAREAGAEIREFESIAGLDLNDEKKTVKTNRTVYVSKAIIFAAGRHYRRLEVPGEKEFLGKGVSYCGLCDGPLFKSKRLLIVGGGNSALMTALYLAGLASEAKIAHRRDSFRAEETLVKALERKQNVEILWNTEIKEIRGERTVKKAILFNNRTHEEKDLAIDGVFVQIGEDPNSQLAREAGVAVDNDGYIVVDILQRTNIRGVYAAGDVTNHPVKQVGTAVGQGITAATEAYGYIRRPYYKE